MGNKFALIEDRETPIIATAIHDGHQVRQELLNLFKLTEKERLREEDPFTNQWTKLNTSRIVVNYSRFEVDVNRPEEKAVYIQPEDAWGLDIWKNSLPQSFIQHSLEKYHAFYESVCKLIDKTIDQFGYAIIYDIHSYNYQRDGEGQYADPKLNPEVNIGTKNMNMQIWRPVVDQWISTAQNHNYNNRSLDVRENVKFGGGYFTKYLYEKYGDKICGIAIEFKKFFMNEWTGVPDQHAIDNIKKMLEKTIHPVINEANKILDGQ